MHGAFCLDAVKLNKQHSADVGGRGGTLTLAAMVDTQVRGRQKFQRAVLSSSRHSSEMCEAAGEVAGLPDSEFQVNLFELNLHTARKVCRCISAISGAVVV